MTKLTHPDPIVYAGPVSVDHDIRDGAVTLSVWQREDGSSELGQRITFRVQPRDLPALVRDVAAQVGYAMDDTVRELAYGDCDTCGNVRLVEVPTHGGRMTNTECPDCRPGPPDPYAIRPVIRKPGPKETST